MFGAFGGGNGKGKKQTGLAATPMAGRPQKPGFSREEEA
jgi:hypothetical protein